MDEPLKRERETARQRALRIPLSYHRTRGPIGIWKVLLSVVGIIVGGLYIVWVLAGGKPAATQVSPGILARDHARWDNDCKSCHSPFIPQRPDAAGARMVSLSLTGAASGDFHRADAKCSQCHKSTGIHHANQFAAEVESCSSCHRDHQGRDFNMARMEDAQCTTCHASIAAHRSKPGNAPVVNVTSFNRQNGGVPGHPAFRSLQMKEDPGNIRFSHRLHMTLGQLYPGQTPPAGKRLEQLACDACHQPEITTGNGAYMRPVKYEQHCRRCHPLGIPGQPEAIVPHGLASKQLESTVRGLLANAKPTTKQPPTRIIPGKSREASEAGTELPLEMQFAQRLAQIRENKCSQCHSWGMLEPNEVLPSRIPTTWLQHVRFNHQKHQNSAKCVDCHAAAAAKLTSGEVHGKLEDDQQIMIPDIDNCLRCHAPRNESAGTGGARFDCAECHRYHHAPIQEKPLRQGGSPASSAVDWPASLRLTLVAHQQAAKSPPNNHPFVGTQSCSTTGCHGAAGKRSISSAFTRYTVDDPHEQAFLLLYSDSSRRMIRRLRGEGQGELSEPAYFGALQEKCIGCHATPPAESVKSNRLESYLAGITCESCHGAAADWELSHFQRGTKPSSLAKLSNFSVRATVCAECHIGPKEMLGKIYDVNHDLIAVGHPRLTFEFEAQLANLPAHWSPAKDVKSHFDAWRLGELATATQQDKLHASRAAQEFASHRCFDCHHGLTSKLAGRITFPHLAVISKEQREWLAEPAPSKQKQADILLKLLTSATDEQNRASAGTRWEEHVHFSLALSAYAADNPQNGGLANRTEALREILINSFRSLPQDRNLKKEASFSGGPYDSPTGFDPADERLKQVLENIRGKLDRPMIVQELHKLQTKHGYLPRQELVALGERLAVPLYRIQEVVSFFPHYRTEHAAELEIHVCQDMACHLRGSAKLIAELQATLEGTASEIRVCGVSCLGRCDRAPAARIYDNRLHNGDGHSVVNQHGRSAQQIAAAAGALLSGSSHDSVVNNTDRTLPVKSKEWQIDIYSSQSPEKRYEGIRWFVNACKRISTGEVDAEAKAAAVQAVLGSLKTAWLLGLGGAGGRAYKKWEETLKEHQKRGEKAYVVCNGDESEPATFKDRELFLRTPHLVVEGVVLAGLLLGATKGYIYIRHEYEEQIEAVRAEIATAESAGLCGENILGSGLNFPVEVFVSPGGYICGEQTALIEAIQDHRAEPRNRPPELQTNGLWDMPTLLSNVETFAWVPAIVVRDQGKWFQEQGQEWNQWTQLTAKLAAETGDRGWTEAFGKSTHFKGRRFFSVSGDVERPGAYEVPIGITLGELIATCGGIRGGEALKAVALSGPSGGFLPRFIKTEHLSDKVRKMLPTEMKAFDLCELQLDMNLFRQWGLMLGAGITIYDESADLVEQAYSASHFYARESCGKCVPCRIGSTKISQVAGQLRERKLSRQQIDELFQKEGPLLDLAGTMSSTAICGLGQIAANPLMSLLRYFPEEAYAYAAQS